MAKPDTSETDKGFKVADHRASSSDSDAPPEPEAAQEIEGSLPQLDFTTFVLSLSTSALMHLGEVGLSEAETLTPNLPLARQTIDLLAVLEQKTKGNLTGEEERLLTHILAELRLRYVQKMKG